MCAQATAISATEPTAHLNSAPDLVDIYFDGSFGVYRCYIKANAPKYFSPELASALLKILKNFQSLPMIDGDPRDFRTMQYHVLGSRIPGVFSLGGDLSRFERLVRTGNRDGLKRYAELCIRLILATTDKSGPPLTRVALVQGRAFGGGFEAALACDIIVAERGCEMGFPEVLFNLFPGMGAYPLLLRRVTPSVATELIEGGKTRKVEELHEMGVVDVIAAKGEGDQTLSHVIKRHRRQSTGRHWFSKSRQLSHPITEKLLFETLELWVECAMNLSQNDLRLMSKFAAMQGKLVS